MEKCYVAYLHYYATGEGVTIIFAIGGTPEQAKSYFNARAPEYFRGDVDVASLASTTSEPGLEIIREMVPESVKRILTKNPPGTTQYYSELHYNLA